MAGATVITGGTYLLELSSGYDSSAFYLDESLLDGTDVLDGDGVDFNDITDVAQLITISRGRHKPLDVFGPGTMSVSISVPVGNRDYDPLNTSSVYYNQLTEQPGLAPLRPIRLSRNGEYLFTGVVTTFNQTYNMAGMAVMVFRTTPVTNDHRKNTSGPKEP